MANNNSVNHHLSVPILQKELYADEKTIKALNKFKTLSQPILDQMNGNRENANIERADEFRNND